MVISTVSIDNTMIKIRRMTDQDIDSVLFIEQASSMNPWTKTIFQDCIRVGYDCWVIDKNEDIIGFVVFDVVAGECHLLNIAIAPRERDSGYGRFLLETALDMIKVKKAERILLEVRMSNEIAIQLYKSVGFVKTGIRKEYYKTYNGRENAILMTLLLDEQLKED